MLSIMGEVAGAAAAAAGLILVFFGAALANFDSYEEGEKNAVRVGYRWRAWPAFVALICAGASCGFALYAKAMSSSYDAKIALVLLGVSAVGICLSAGRAVVEIG